METIKSLVGIVLFLVVGVLILPPLVMAIAPIFFMLLIIVTAVCTLWGLALAVSH